MTASFGGDVTTSDSFRYQADCKLSDIRLYNRVLTGAEITAIAAGDW
jgi:hypothetical protein